MTPLTLLHARREAIRRLLDKHEDEMAHGMYTYYLGQIHTINVILNRVLGKPVTKSPARDLVVQSD